MTERAIVFQCNGDDLVAVLHEREDAARAVGVLIVVGGPQYRVGSHRQFVLMARSLAARGFPVFRFDYRGMGDSSGHARTFTSVDDDVRWAIDTFFEQTPRLRRVVIFGLCDAASAALMYARFDSRVCGLILANPWVHTETVQAKAVIRHYYVRRILQRSFWIRVISGELRLRQSVAEFLSALQSSLSRRDPSQQTQPHFVERMRDGLAGFEGPVLLLLSENDLTAREFETLCGDSVAWQRLVSRPIVSTHRLGSADHTLSSAKSLDEALCAIQEWLVGSHLAERDLVT